MRSNAASVADRALTGVMVLAIASAFVAGGAFLYQHLDGSGSAPVLLAEDDWAAVTRSGRVIGSESARVDLVAFGDFQCPACARFALDVWPAIERRFGDEVALRYRHWPLRPGASFAAAVAAECAGDQGYFRGYHDVLYQRQREIGRVDFADWAVDVGVPDIDRFRECLGSGEHRKRIEDDVATVRRVGGRGTPTLVLGGRLLPLPYDSSTLIGVIGEELRRPTNP